MTHPELVGVKLDVGQGILDLNVVKTCDLLTLIYIAVHHTQGNYGYMQIYRTLGYSHARVVFSRRDYRQATVNKF